LHCNGNVSFSQIPQLWYCHTKDSAVVLQQIRIGLNSMKKALALVIGICGGVVASWAQLDTISLVNLPTIEVVTQTPIGRDRMDEVVGAIIYAGKKNELIRPNNLNADLSINNSRQIFGRVPGVNVWESDGSGIQTSIATRGLSPNRSWEFNVRQNGYDIAADPFGYPEAYYAPPMEAVERIEFLRGASSLAFGPQFGGSLNYVLKKGNTNKLKPIEVEARQTFGSYGLTNTFVGVGATIKKFTVYSYLHSRSAEGWRENSRYHIFNGHAYVGYAISSKMKVGVEFTHMDYESQQPGGLTDAQFNTNARQSSRERNWMGTPWNVAAITYNYAINPRNEVDVKIFGMISERNSVGFTSAVTVIDSAQFARTVDRDFYTNVGAEARYKKLYNLFGLEHVLTGGVRYFNGVTERKQRGTGTAGNDFDLSLVNPKWGRALEFETNNTAVFVENIFHVGKNFIITPGVRLETIGSTASGYTTISGTDFQLNDSRTRNVFVYGISTEYHIKKVAEIYASFAKAYRPVMFSDLTPSATTDVVDPNLEDASGYSTDFGVRGKIGRGFSYDVSAYYMLYDNRIGRVTENGVVNIRNVGATETTGVEAYLEWSPCKAFDVDKNRFGCLDLFISAGFTNAEYTEWNNPAAVENTALSIVGNKVEYAPEQIHRAGFTYAYRKFAITYQWNMSSDFYTDANNTEEPTTNAQSGKLDGYQVSDLTLSFKPTPNYLFSIGANNLTDERYATRRAGGYPGPGLLPANARTIFATVGLKF
jgi:Fe(3+) dicitrate transport protein